MSKFKRSKVYIDKKVQGALARRVMMHWFGFFAASLLCLFGLQYFMGDPTLSFMGHLEAVWNQYAFFVLLMVAMIPTFIYDTMKLSNRFAGPILRLRNSMKELAEGKEVKEIKFRENDFWLDLSDDFNRVLNIVKDEEAKAVK